MKQTILKNAWGLAIFAMCTAGLISITQWGTSERIAEEELKFKKQALFQIFPEDIHDNDMLNDTVVLVPEPSTEDADQADIKALASEGPVTVHRARFNDEIIGVIIPTSAPDAYTEPVKILVGVRKNGELAGVRIIRHKETPGLGDKVDLQKSDWVLSFNDKSFANLAADKWKVKKDGGEFDQFTGATITPRAIVKAVKKTLDLYTVYQSALLDSSIQEIVIDNVLVANNKAEENSQ